MDAQLSQLAQYAQPALSLFTAAFDKAAPSAMRTSTSAISSLDRSACCTASSISVREVSSTRKIPRDAAESCSRRRLPVTADQSYAPP